MPQNPPSPLRSSLSHKSLVQLEQNGEIEASAGEAFMEGSIAYVDFKAASSSSPPPGSLSWKYNFFSPLEAFQRLKQGKEEASLLAPSSPPPPIFTEGLNLPLVGEVRWEVVKNFAKEWLKNPKNLALLLWGLAVGVSGALLFLVMVGLLDEQLPNKSQRDAWFEVNNQILNALFTLMCLYLHPQRCHHLVMLLRWEPQDIRKLREVYCKNGTYKPHEWAHILVVVVLLHVNCFAQYALCGLNWGFKRSQRPPVGVGLCLAVAIGAPAVAGIYSILSPLGKNYHVEEEDELQMQETALAQIRKLEEKPSLRIGRAPRLCFGEVSFVSRDGELVAQPEWRGGLFDCCSDPPVAFLSTVSGFCVFGWNMERLGFGNRYVHIVTFILLCSAPYWIFNLAAINIDNSHVRRGLGVSGIILSVFGLLYGGFWRIQMRKTFGLPAQKWCCGHPNLTDCTQWLFCGPCSLCQEVRTSEYYKIHESKFYERRALSEMSPVPSPPSRWTSPGPYPLGTEASSPIYFSPSPVLLPHKKTATVETFNHRLEIQNNEIVDGAMQPPVPPVLEERSSSL